VLKLKVKSNRHLKAGLLLAILCFLLGLNSASAQAISYAWARSLGPMYASAVSADANGNVYTAGFFQGTIDFDPGPGVFNLTATANSADIFISKYNSAGNFIWAKALGSSMADYALAIAGDGTGAVIVTGFFQGTCDFDPGPGAFSLTAAGGQDVFVVKLDPNGGLAWARSFGGSSNDVAKAIALDESGNIYTTGFYSGSVDFDPGVGTFNLFGQADVFISKLDAAGNFVWAKSFGSGNNWEQANSLAVGGGCVYTTGYFSGTVDFNPGIGTFNLQSSGGSADAFVSKLDAAGNFVWAIKFGGKGTDEGVGITLDSWGNAYATGSIIDTVDFDPGPGTYTLASHGYYDAYVSKLDASGALVWAKNVGGNSAGSSLATDAVGNVYTVGSFESSAPVDFDPGPGTYTLSAEGLDDIFILALDVVGNFIDAKKLGKEYTDLCYTITRAPNGAMYMVGALSSYATFDDNTGTFTFSSAASSFGAYVLRLGNMPTDLHEYAAPGQVRAYPNPFSHFATIQTDVALTEGALMVYDVFGKTVRTITSISGNTTCLDGSGLAPGVYFYELSEKNRTFGQGKLVVSY
jgi:hypothetical protein